MSTALGGKLTWNRPTLIALTLLVRQQEKEEDEYRDRAKERRLGVSNEYAISEEAVKDLTVEESKYLGGDMEHTHLVKGLDFALLAKIRSEMEDKEPEVSRKQKSDHRKESEALAARSALGGAMRAQLMQQSHASKPSELFLQGRTTFIFSLDEDFGDIPTTKSKSIEDLTAAARERKLTFINRSMMSSISTIMTYLRQGSRPANQKKLKRKVIEENPKVKPFATAAAASKLPEDDIFYDAGSYDLTMRAAERAAQDDGR